MNRIYYFLVFVILLLCLMAFTCNKVETCPGSNCDDLGELTVVVTHRNNNGVTEKLADVIVEIPGFNFQPTDENGEVVFNLCPGNYSYEIRLDGYESSPNNQTKLIAQCGSKERVPLEMKPNSAILQIVPNRISLTRDNPESFITVRNAGVNTLEWSASILGGAVDWIEIVGDANGFLSAGEMKNVFIRADFDNFLAAGGSTFKEILFEDQSGNSPSETAIVDVIPELVFDVNPGDLVFDKLESYKDFTITLTENISSPVFLNITTSGFPEGVLSLSTSQPTLSINGQVETVSLELERTALSGYGVIEGRIFIDAGNNGVEVLDVRIEHPNPDDPYLEVVSSSVNTELLAFGSSSLQETLTLKNDGQSTLSWSIVENFPSWIEMLSGPSGQLAANEEIEIDFQVDRTTLEEGVFYTDEIEINSNGGNRLISTTISKGDPILESNSLIRFPFNGNVDNLGTSSILATNNGGVFTLDPMGTPDKAISFNGENSYVALTNPIQDEPSFTVSFWMKNLIHSSSSKTLLSLKGNNWFEVKVQNDKLSVINKYGSNSGSINTVTCNSTLDENWNHIVILYNKISASQRTMVVYINGINSGFTILNSFSAYVNSQVSSIGCLNSNSEYWNGNLDDLRIYPNILNDDQISILGGGN